MNTTIFLLEKLPLNTKAKINKINIEGNPDLGLRLWQLGFLENQEIKVIRKSPLNGKTLLVEVRGAQVALTNDEASIISVVI